MRLFQSNRGDTIVEVLLALAVLGSVIVGAYSIATRSLNGVRVAQERSEATKIAEGQIESLKANFSQYSDSIDLIGGFAGITRLKDETYAIPLGVNSSWDTAPGWSGSAPWPDIPFCYKQDGTVLRYNTANPFPADCLYASGSNYLYKVRIDTIPDEIEYLDTLGGSAPLDQFKYRVTISWPRSGGGVDQTLILEDRFVVQ